MESKIINIGVAGSIETDTGQKTQTILQQISLLKNMSLKAFYNNDIKIAEEVLIRAGLIDNFKYLSIKNKRYPKIESFYTDDLEIFTDYSVIDVFIVSEINSKVATEVIYSCLSKGKKIINLNAISEITLGLIFKKLAKNNNTIYSVGAGDEPAVTLGIIDSCNKIGLDIICAGKGKNNPLNIYCTAEDFLGKEKDFQINPFLMTSFVDGTKTMLEMAILSNASGIPIDDGGMHGPKVNVDKLLEVFKQKKDGGILYNIPVIDYAIGDVAPGVFVIVTSQLKSIREELKYLKVGKGPNFVLFKPYHLANIEVLLSVYDVAFNNRPTLTVRKNIETIVVAKAKKNLNNGIKIDSAGGYTFSGIAIKFDDFSSKDYVPIGLVENSFVEKDIKKGEIITFGKINGFKDSIVFKLWKEQIKLLNSM
jgi:predicted homoserine dehydrogenase-like protein